MNRCPPIRRDRKNSSTHPAIAREISRRRFATLFGWSSLAALTGALVAMAQRFSSAMTVLPGAAAVAEIDELPVGGYKLFRYPTDNDPCILIRLAAASYVAFNQRCTHLMCPVHFNAPKRQLVCPCHEGVFSAEDGRVLAGPPPRALPRYTVEVRERTIWILPPSNLR